MLACFEDATESTWGLPSIGPKRRSRFTSALTSTCSASVKPSHHPPNSSVNSTSHSAKGIYLQKPNVSMVVAVLQNPFDSSRQVWDRYVASRRRHRLRDFCVSGGRLRAVDLIKH